MAESLPNPDLSDGDNLNLETMNRWIGYCLEYWVKEQYQDKDLWYIYQEDFVGWTKEIFLLVYLKEI